METACKLLNTVIETRLIKIFFSSSALSFLLSFSIHTTDRCLPRALGGKDKLRNGATLKLNTSEARDDAN